ncbi:EamA family transporter RarD [Marinobacter sp. X15-166B]|uniref:EamA family transporter RarD n=1 Tax=Marinobacter sp. X15-166B TaxID=1897620 RepID=UPI00085BFBA5|nr:EamA family transporter RarD [Marinobacter sp. X15-166B]OEY65405.1 chemotaxis protein [Marinobacter sp. X15-166B]
MHTSPNTSLGVTLNVIASVFFALMFAYTSLLDALSGEEIYGWRMLLTFPCLTLIILLRGYWAQVVVIYQRLRRERYLWATRLVAAALVGVQQWLFLWAPGNGYGLAVSLGYFMLPITMVIVGRIAFNDRMSRLQQLACVFAVLGIVNQMALSQTLEWPTLVICLGYPGYFWLRRKTDTNNIGGLWFDMLLSLPVSLLFIVAGGQVIASLDAGAGLSGLVLGLGMLSALALAFQSLSAPHLNLSLFGLLVYVEPVLLLLVALLLGESILPGEWPTYIAIWLAVLVLTADGVRGLRRQRRVRNAAVEPAVVDTGNSPSVS